MMKLFDDNYRNYKAPSPVIFLNSRYFALSKDFRVIAKTRTYYSAYASAYLKGIKMPYIVKETDLRKI